MTSNTTTRLVRCPRCRNILPEPPGVPVYECGACHTKLQAKKPKISTVDTTSQRLEDDSLGKRRTEQLSDNQEAGSSSNQQSLVNPTDEPYQNSDQNDLHSSNNDQDADSKMENGTVDTPSSGKWKMKQISDDQEACSSSNQQLIVNSVDGPDRNTDRNDPRSSTELSGHEDPESSPETAVHNRIVQEEDHYQDAAKKQESVTVDATKSVNSVMNSDQLSDDNANNLTNELDQNRDHNEPHNSSELSYHEDSDSSPEATVQNRIDDQEFKSCRNEVGFEGSSSSSFSELGETSREAIANMKMVRDSDNGSKSSFKSLIAERLLDTRQKKVMYLDEDDISSEDGTADLRHRRRFDRVSSVETSENVRFGGVNNYYGYEGSVSSFDGNEDQFTRSNRNGSKGGEHFDSGHRNRFNRRNESHPLSGRLGKDEHRLTDVRSIYGLNEFHVNPRNRSPMIPENPKMERIQLSKMVRELQDQLDRTSISNSGQQIPSHYNHVLNNPGRYGHRMAFSGETTAVDRRRDGGTCHHCFLQDRHFSAQLPRQHVCCNGPHYGPNTHYSPRFSRLSSPKQHSVISESEFSAPDVIKPYRSPKKKIYVRPICGGSPWITCYRCSELLQLPQSLLVFKKKYHSLRCGACLKILDFTLSNGTHISRYYPEETIIAPPSSEVEDNGKSTGPRVDPVSYSDRSFQRGYSTETDRNGSWEYSEERKKGTMSRDPSGSTRPGSSKVSGRRKTTSEVEPRPNGSPLHRLMGYASPSKVIRGDW